MTFLKRLIRWPFKIAWRASAPIRVAVGRRAEVWLDPYVTLVADCVADRSNMELDLAATEIARIERQVEGLAATLEKGV